MDKAPKHTPGPWLVKAGRNIETSSGTFYLTYGKDRYGNPLFRDFVELDHNAQLTAAGPAMYEALKRIKVLMESGDIEGRDWVEYGHIINALAQAEGR